MSLLVVVSRAPAEPWGFRLIGGAEYTMPLTIVKIQPGTAAEASVLLHGDTLMSINGQDAASMRHEEAYNAIKESGELMELEVVRGHYDMVLEEEYSEVQQEDSDLPSDPTEVLPTEPPSLDSDIIPIPELELLKPQVMNADGTRSQTASPFVLPTKPYRPFSTEPIQEVPDLENPIILNPGYHDEFGIVKEVLIDDIGILKGCEDYLPKTRFKLPVSEQYDPEFGKEKKGKEEIKGKKKEEGRSFVSEVAHTSLTEYKSVEEKVTREEIRFMEQMKKDIDLDRIEETANLDQRVQQTAINVVEDSITKAIIVAEEIKKEIDVELMSSKTEDVKNSVVVADEIKKLNEVELLSLDSRKEEKSCTKVKSDVKYVESKVNSTDLVTKGFVIKKESQSEQSEKADRVELKEEQHVSSAKQEMEETIVAESVKRLTTNFNQESELNTNDKKEATQQTVATAQKRTADVKQDVKKSNVETNRTAVKQESNIQHNHVETKVSSAESKTTKTSQKTEPTGLKNGQKMSTSRLLAEQRAYTIGLQTIPNIRGNVHTSYHYDLLLKTFFIHLTDVMVALSRFILAEPVLSQSDNKTEHVATEEYIQKEKAETKFQVKDMPTEQIQAEIKEVEEKPCVKKFVKQRMETESDKIEVENQVIDKKKSGCKMAQLTEHKPEELTNKMDAVITEFQTKAGIEEEVFEVDARKETEVATLEESSKMKTNKTEIKEISSEMICSIKESNETNRDSRSESRSGKTTYTAIVESHVYTNKDAIFEEQFSETSSLQNGDAVSISELIENAAESKSVETVADETQKFSVIEAVESLAKIVEANTLRENKVEKCKETSLQTSHESVIAETVQQENTSSKVEAVKINEEKIKSVETVADKSQQYSVIEAVESSAKIVEANTLQDNKVEKCKDMSLQTSHKSVIAETVQQENTSSKVEAVEINENKIKSSIEESREAYTSTALSETQKFKTEDIKSDSNGIEKVVLSELIVEKAKEILIVEPTDEPKADVEVEVMMIRPPSRKPSKVMAEDVQATIQKLKEVSPAKETFTTIQSDMEVTSTTKTEFSNMSEVKHRKKESEVIQTRQELEVFESKQKSEVRKTEQEIKVLETKQEIKTNQTKQEKEVMQTTQDSLTAKREARAESLSRLTLDLKEESPKKLTSQDSFTSTIDTPTPASVPPTPITDEYMFRINTPLPKCTGPQPDPDTPSPEKEIDHEDFGIVKKKLNPYIETEIERTVYDLPLPTPIEVKDAPVFGAAERSKSLSERSSEEEIREIERTSSLLASVINETIKSIEEYKEQVGMETRREDREEIREKIRAETKPMYSSFVNEPVTTIYAEVKPVTKETTIIDAISDLGKYNTRRASQTETVSLTGMNESMTEISSQATEKTSSIITREMSSAAQEMSSRATQELQESSETSQSEVKEIKGYRPVVFDQEELRQKSVERDEQRLAGFRSVQLDIQEAARVSVPRELVQEGETLATRQGIISGLADRGAQDSNELGKPGISEKKIAEIVSGESEMLREAHVMGLKRVIASHMTRPGDSSIDFNKIKPVIDSLKDSAVLAALNDELTKTKEEKKKDERKWTTFLQKPERPTPKAKFGYHGWLPQFDPKQKPYKVEIKKQPKPKVAPDYKPERAGFETGALPWEERAANEPPQPPLPAEDPILIPEQEPEFYEAVDPMPESEVPDLEETGIPLPPERTEEDTAPAAETVNPEELEPDAPAPAEEEKAQEPEVTSEEMEQSRLAEQLLNNVQGMVDPNATLEQQLSQMRAQLAALAQLPGVIQQTLELVSKQLMQLTQTETKVVKETTEVVEQVEVTKTETVQEVSEETQVSHTQEQTIRAQEQTNQTQEQSQTTVAVQEVKQEISAEEVELKRRQEEELMRSEKEKKEQEELARLEHESRQVKHHPTPRAGKPKPAFGPLVPQERPIVLTGGRKWRKPKDAYNDQFYTEQLAAQAEIIQGNTKGFSYESVLLPYDERINFMKYEKPPVSLDHLQRSDVYKMIHNMEQVPLRRTDLLTPVVAECDYREKCRSMSPCVRGMERCNMP